MACLFEHAGVLPLAFTVMAKLARAGASGTPEAAGVTSDRATPPKLAELRLPPAVDALPALSPALLRRAPNPAVDDAWVGTWRAELGLASAALEAR